MLSIAFNQIVKLRLKRFILRLLSGTELKAAELKAAKLKAAELKAVELKAAMTQSTLAYDSAETQMTEYIRQ